MLTLKTNKVCIKYSEFIVYKIIMKKDKHSDPFRYHILTWCSGQHRNGVTYLEVCRGL